jgi:hypothetical protein
MAARLPDSIAHKNLRSALLFAYSVLLGGVFGVFAAFGMRMGFMADLALLFGAVAGLFTSPALMFALRHGPVLSGLAWITVPTALAAYAGGLLTPPNDGPFLSMAVSISVYLLASLLRGFAGLKYHQRLPANSCPSCTYDLQGLPPSAACPECGASIANTESR